MSVSSMRTAITAEKLWDGTNLLDHPVVVVEDGRIDSIGTRAASELPGPVRIFEYPGATLSLSLIHI